MGPKGKWRGQGDKYVSWNEAIVSRRLAFKSLSSDWVLINLNCGSHSLFQSRTYSRVLYSSVPQKSVDRSVWRWWLYDEEQRMKTMMMITRRRVMMRRRSKRQRNSGYSAPYFFLESPVHMKVEEAGERKITRYVRPSWKWNWIQPCYCSV